MATARRSSADQIAANEGHVGDILLWGAVDSLFDEVPGPLTTGQIADALVRSGFPAGNSHLLRDDIGGMLRDRPETFAGGRCGWSRRDSAERDSAGSDRRHSAAIWRSKPR